VIRRGHRRAAAVAAVVGAVASLSACADHGTVLTQDTVGDSSVAINVLIDTPAVPPVRCVMRVYVRGEARGIKFGGASAEEIATTVKDGQRVDLVILPAGSALDRIRDELAAPAAPLAAVSRNTYWVGAVTNKGLAFARFLTGRQGHLAFASHACISTAAAR